MHYHVSAAFGSLPIGKLPLPGNSDATPPALLTDDFELTEQQREQRFADTCEAAAR